ncbi:MAG: mitofilin family membrane protein [Methyloceanibacter sp.]
MADTFGDQDKGPGGRRPAPTIEGTATEVLVEPPSGPGASPDAGPKGDAGPERPLAGDGGSEQPTHMRTPPPPASVFELKSFLTHMAAGLLGGLVGVVALGLAWGWLPGKADKGAGLKLSGLEQRLAQLEASRPRSGDADVQGLSALDQRVAELEARPSQPPQDLAELTGRVQRLEQSLKALADMAAKGGLVADAAAVNAEIGAAEQRLQAKIDAALGEGRAADTAALGTVEREVADLKARIEAFAATTTFPDASSLQGDLTGLTDRIGKLEAALPGLAVAIDKGATQAKGAAVALAFGNLRDAVASGHPYAVELSMLRALAPGEGALEALASHADAGIPTLADLTRSFQTASDAALGAEAAPADASILGSLLGSARSLVKVRHVDATATGDAPGAILARAAAQLKQGELALVVKEVEGLAPPPREAFAPWLDQARTRLAAADTLNRLEAPLLASMGGAAPAPATAPAQQ